MNLKSKTKIKTLLHENRQLDNKHPNCNSKSFNFNWFWKSILRDIFEVVKIPTVYSKQTKLVFGIFSNWLQSTFLWPKNAASINLLHFFQLLFTLNRIILPNTFPSTTLSQFKGTVLAVQTVFCWKKNRKFENKIIFAFFLFSSTMLFNLLIDQQRVPKSFELILPSFGLFSFLFWSFSIKFTL